jgi:hypothetical protein
VGVQPELEECRDGGAQIQGQHQLNGHAQQIPNASIADREGSQIAAGVASTAIQVSSQSPHTAGGPATQQSPSVAHLHSQHHSPARPASVWAADAAALCILLLLTGLSIGYGVVWAREDVYINSQPGTVLWYGMLVGPFGCLLRWHLAGFNARPAPGTASSGTTWWVGAGQGGGGDVAPGRVQRSPRACNCIVRHDMVCGGGGGGWEKVCVWGGGGGW